MGLRIGVTFWGLKGLTNGGTLEYPKDALYGGAQGRDISRKSEKLDFF